MPAPALATDGPVKDNGPVKDMVRGLVVDDLPAFTQELSEFLQRQGFEVDIAFSPEEAAELVSNHVYHLVISDVRFDNSKRTGDEFIVENFEKMTNAKIVAVTAFGPERILRRSELQDLGVTILQKAEHMRALKNLATRVVQQRRGMFAPKQILDELHAMIVKWVESKENPDKPGIFYKGELYSPRELLTHIEQGTEVGNEHLRMLVNLIKYRVGMENEADESD